MRLQLEFVDDMAVLHIIDTQGRIEIRGPLGIGTQWTGTRLDRLLAALPGGIVGGLLFAGEIADLRERETAIVKAFLATEDQITEALFSSVLAENGLKARIRECAKADEIWYEAYRDRKRHQGREIRA